MHDCRVVEISPFLARIMNGIQSPVIIQVLNMHYFKINSVTATFLFI
jgi:hypothetical protein